MKLRPRGAGVVAALVVAAATLLLVGSAATPAAGEATPILTHKLRSDITALLASRHARDPRLDRLVPGHRPGELAYFVVLDTPRTGAHRAALERTGARILREYQTIDAFAVASVPRVLKRVALLPGVTRLVPVEVIETTDEQEVDQSKATTADVGAPSLWNQGITGTGIRIAVLDTGPT